MNITISDDGLDEDELGTDIRTTFITETLGKGTSVTLDTHRQGYDEGRITVDGEINVENSRSGATLTLKANEAININKNITFTGEKAPNLTLETTEAGSSINNGANINICNGTLNITTGKNGVLSVGSIGADTVRITANTIKQAKMVTPPVAINQLELRQANENKDIYIGDNFSSSTGAESMADASLFASGGVFSQVGNLKLNAGRNQDIHLQDVDFQDANIIAIQDKYNSGRTLNIAGKVSTKGSLEVETEKFNVADNARLTSSSLQMDEDVNIIRAGSNAKIISTNNEAFTYNPGDFDLQIVNNTYLTRDYSINYDFLNAWRALANTKLETTINT